ncbi:hypothetical protein [Amycolatopsis viridis]|uniref:WXG100 family type VII secretion target n=1 Tax=Amycolatopsis viridis TaxID=185678 RepID=A0ABX0SZW5_9PSEU|nr:hypothetical protein [Amycolatopsis viridis]NIH81472.1 hypothetical protein [Amycolatopsis viridis]
MHLVADQVTRLRQLLDDTKLRGAQLCQSMHGDLENVIGSDWIGAASNAGQITSADMLAFWRSKLEPILDKLVNGITGTQNVMTAGDDESRSSIEAAGSTMHFHSRMSHA